MALSKEDQLILEEILKLNGDCLDGRPRCKLCPFRSMCLPEFINPNPPSKKQRFDMAMRVLVHHCLINSDDDAVVEEEYDGVYRSSDD